MNTLTFPISRPPLALFGTELWRAGIEFLAQQFDRPQADETGDGHTVVIFPGLGTGGHAIAPLRAHCRALGYAAVDWGRGYNTGPAGSPESWLRSLADDVAELIDLERGGATLIGWSLGGVYAREVAKLIPDRTRQVITIGTPFNADRDHTNVGWLLRMLGSTAPDFDAAMCEALRTPPPVPTTSIYSRSDGVVAWQTCIHEASPSSSRTSRSSAATSAWAGTGTCCASSKTVSGRCPGSGVRTLEPRRARPPSLAGGDMQALAFRGGCR